MYKSDGYKKLKAFADKEGTSVIEILCQLNIHDRGYDNAGVALYDRFIHQMAPMDIADSSEKNDEEPLKPMTLK